MGSPPRVRGKDDPCFSFRDNLGITPACAGKSVRLVEMFLRHGDHPRVCGEKDPVFPGLLLHLGSPPRVRGKEFWGCCCAGCHRITPACAGKSIRSSEHCASPWDHPRVCGEKNSIFCPVFSVTGSPPRVRGKDATELADHEDRRITPACAGKRGSTMPKVSRLWDHPRVCGEKPVYGGHFCPVLGSPPRVRGKVEDGQKGLDRLRITPACAGKRQLILEISFLNRDHPRVCGEKPKCSFPVECLLGSPPRVRGKVVL